MSKKTQNLQILTHPVDLSEKIIALTGATGGMGLPLARRIAVSNATLLILARNSKKANIVCSNLKKETKNNKIYIVKLDLSDMESIKSAASSIRSQYNSLDVLICNAGVEFFGKDTRQTTKDGFDMTMGVNHFGNSALILHLLQILRATPNSRIVINASEQYRKNQFLNLEDLDLKQNYSHKHAYRQSKLANILFARALARREPTIKIYTLHPGGVYTPMMKRALGNGFLVPRRLLRKYVFLSPDEAAAGIERVAVDPDLSSPSGSFFWTGKETDLLPVGLNDDTGDHLWVLTLKMLNFDKKRGITSL